MPCAVVVVGEVYHKLAKPVVRDPSSGFASEAQRQGDYTASTPSWWCSKVRLGVWSELIPKECAKADNSQEPLDNE